MPTRTWVKRPGSTLGSAIPWPCSSPVLDCLVAALRGVLRTASATRQRSSSGKVKSAVVRPGPQYAGGLGREPGRTKRPLSDETPAKVDLLGEVRRHCPTHPGTALPTRLLVGVSEQAGPTLLG